MAPDGIRPGAQLVGLGGLEPPTPRLSSVCSNQLSYRPVSLKTSIFYSNFLLDSNAAHSLTLALGLFAVRFVRRSVCSTSKSDKCARLLRYLVVAFATQYFYCQPFGCAAFRLLLLASWFPRMLSHPGYLVTCKEVIQPQVPLRLPCYDFVPVMNHTVVGDPPETSSGLIYPLLVPSTPMT